MSSDPHVEILVAERVPEVAHVLARALHDDPAYLYLLPATRRARTDALAGFFSRNLRVHLPYRCTHLLCDADGRVIATVTLRPPGGVDISLATMLRHGLLPFVAQNGVAAMARMLRLKGLYDGIEAALGAGKPHWHVHMMAVLPEEQGRGHGALLLDEVLSRLVDVEDAAGNAHPVVLTTHKAKNCTFYQRAGFDIVDERALTAADGPAGYTVWSMRRARFSEQVGGPRL
jgi:GNAT superfamily N-acetyltransferase